MRRSININCSIFILCVILVISGFFLLDIEKIALNYWALGFLLFSFTFSMLVSLGGTFLRSTRDNVFNIVGLYSAIFIYQIGVIVCTIFTPLFKENVGTFIFIQIAINIVFTVVLITIISFTGYLNKVDDKTFDKIKSGEYDSPKRGGF